MNKALNHPARFVPQAWTNDVAIEVDLPENAEAGFDVTDHVVGMSRAEAINLCNTAGQSDELIRLPAAPKWMRQWRGPFCVDAANSIRDFFETEIASEAYDEIARAAIRKAGFTLFDEAPAVVKPMDDELDFKGCQLGAWVSVDVWVDASAAIVASRHPSLPSARAGDAAGFIRQQAARPYADAKEAMSAMFQASYERNSRPRRRIVGEIGRP